PLSLLRGEAEEGEVEKAAAITVRYSKAKDLGKVEVTYTKVNGDGDGLLSVPPILEKEIEGLMIS
ncbi:MAG: hypothetical protein MUP41_16150, partial [Desulfobacterales bacterium]|nr:hypothetical protein [Desulfobacterales bacterium]